MKKRILLACLAASFTLPAFAALPRVFVSGLGTDTGGCGVNAPCRNFAYALTQVTVGGEVIALDTAGYGSFTIDKSISVIAAPGATAFVSSSSLNAITINAAATATVTLRGLAITSSGATVGIKFQSGQSLNVENCLISGFSAGGSSGIDFTRASSSDNPHIHILNSTFRRNYYGIYAINTTAFTPTSVSVNNSSFADCFFGVAFGDQSHGTIADSVLAGNSTGVVAFGTASGTSAEVNLERCTIAQNVVGIVAGQNLDQTARATIRVANSMIFANTNGIITNLDGVTATRLAAGSWSTNTVQGNTTDGAFSSTYAAK